MLMARENPISVEILMKCLKDFRSMSGLRANVLKSNIFTPGTQSHDLGVILALTGFQQGSMSFRYLGISLSMERLRVSYYALLIDKISEKINARKASSLCYADRVELIRVVLQGAECFWLSIPHVLIAVIENIYHICWIFLWNSMFFLVSWRDVCLLKRKEV